VPALVALAEVQQRALRDPKAAAAALQSALALAAADPTQLSLVERYGRVTGDWKTFARLCDELVDGAAAAALPGTLALRLSAGRVWREKLRNHEAADRHARLAIEAAPDDPRPRVALAEGLIGRDDRAAIDQLRRVVEEHPLDGPAYRGLALACSHAGQPGTAALAASAADLLGEKDEAVEQALMPLRLVAAPRPRQGSLPPDEALRQLVGATRAAHFRELAAVLDPFLHELFPDGARRLAGATAIPEGLPAASPVRTIALALGVPEIALHRAPVASVQILPGAPPALLLPPELLDEVRVARLLFEVGGALARVAARATLAVVEPRQEVQALVDAILRPEREDTGPRELRKRIAKVLPRRARKELERLVEESSRSALVAEWTAWEEEERRRALRAGVVFARDLRGAAEVLVPAAPSDADGDRRRRLAASEDMREALRFAASESCRQANERIYPGT
jgi:hypothetical protein